MKKLFYFPLILVFAVLALPLIVDAQGIGRGTRLVGKTHSTANFGSDNQFFLREADVQWSLFDYEATFFALENAVAQNPQSAIALLQRAKFRKLVGMETEAAEDTRMAKLLNPYAADLFGYSGTYSILNLLAYQPERSVLDLGVHFQTDTYYSILDREYMQDNLAEQELDRLDTVVRALEKESWTEASLLLEEVVLDFPHSALGYDLKGMVLSKLGQPAEAVEALNKAVDLAPDFAIAWYNLGQLERALGNDQRAAYCIDRALALQTDLAIAYFDRALLRKAQGDREGAVQDYTRVIELGGEANLEAFLNRGLTRKMLGDFPGALTDLNEVLEQDPQSAQGYKNRANLYLLFGLHDLAVQDYTRAIQLDENDAEAYYNRGLSFILLYDNASACFDLQRSAELGYDRAVEKRTYFCFE